MGRIEEKEQATLDETKLPHIASYCYTVLFNHLLALKINRRVSRMVLKVGILLAPPFCS
jgi:hypothetical protein